MEVYPLQNGIIWNIDLLGGSLTKLSWYRAGEKSLYKVWSWQLLVLLQNCWAGQCYLQADLSTTKYPAPNNTQTLFALALYTQICNGMAALRFIDS